MVRVASHRTASGLFSVWVFSQKGCSALTGLGTFPMTNDEKTGPQAAGPLSAADTLDLSKRASDIGEGIEAVRNRRQVPKRRDVNQGQGMGRALKVSAELIGGVGVGSVLGWFLDKWLGTYPWLFILFFFLGTGAGLLNIVRQAQRETTPPAPSVVDDEDDT